MYRGIWVSAVGGVEGNVVGAVEGCRGGIEECRER